MISCLFHKSSVKVLLLWRPANRGDHRDRLLVCLMTIACMRTTTILAGVTALEKKSISRAVMAPLVRVLAETTWSFATNQHASSKLLLLLACSSEQIAFWAASLPTRPCQARHMGWDPLRVRPMPPSRRDVPVQPGSTRPPSHNRAGLLPASGLGWIRQGHVITENSDRLRA